MDRSYQVNWLPPPAVPGEARIPRGRPPGLSTTAGVNEVRQSSVESRDREFESAMDSDDEMIDVQDADQSPYDDAELMSLVDAAEQQIDDEADQAIEFGADEYEEDMFDPFQEPFYGFVEEEEEEEEEEESSKDDTTAAELKALPIDVDDSSSSPIDDPSFSVPHKRTTENLQPFKLALGLWLNEVGISRVQYKSLREILSMVDHPLINTLPGTLDIYKRYSRGSLPLLPMRKKAIPLIPEKLASRTPGGKKSSDIAATTDMYFFDAIGVMKAFLESNVTDIMYFGYGEYRDRETELWHSKAWRSSLRTTSGQYPEYRMGGGMPVFVSDFVLYQCGLPNCSCLSPDIDNPDIDNIHLGRVVEVGRDMTTPISSTHGEIVVAIQVVHRPQDLSAHIVKAYDIDEDELILGTDIAYYPVSFVWHHVSNVFLDYIYEDKKLQEQPHSDDWSFPECPDGYYFVRRLMDSHTLGVSNAIEGVTPAATHVPLCCTNPLPAELELATYGRARFETLSKKRCLSVPMLTFIDGLNIYRNAVRSLMGFYLIMASLTFQEQARRANVLPITLGPHGSNFKDVVSCLVALTKLDASHTMALRNRSLFHETAKGESVDVEVMAFTLFFIGDTPQQQANSGMRNQNSTFECRCCYITKEEKSNLDYDTVEEGRYHHQLCHMRDMANTLPTVTQREKCFAAWSMNSDEIPLLMIAPALDLKMSRPTDPAHAELLGTSKRMFELSMTTILTPVTNKTSSSKLFAGVLRNTFPFPPGWARLMSPLHNLGSYRMSEFARASIILPLLLRCWLRSHHVQVHFFDALESRLVTMAEKGSEQWHPVDFIVRCFAAVAKSNSIVLSNEQDNSRMAKANGDILFKHVLEARELYKTLFIAAAKSIHSNPSAKTRGATRAFSPSQSVSRAPSLVPSLAPIIEVDESEESVAVDAATTLAMNAAAAALARPLTEAQQKNIKIIKLQESTKRAKEAQGVELKKRENEYNNDILRPNFHAAKHYDVLLKVLGQISHCGTFIGEDKHRWFKSVVYLTNHRNVEWAMLQRENVRQSVRLILGGAYEHAEPETTAVLREIFESCPTLFESLLPRSEHYKHSRFTEEEVQDEEESDLCLSDDNHQRPSAINFMKARSIKAEFGYPVRNSQMDAEFEQALRFAYATSYNKPAIFFWDVAAITWYRKVSFYDTIGQRRIIIGMRDFISTINPGNSNLSTTNRNLARVDHIFIHTHAGEKRVFLILSRACKAEYHDTVLDLSSMSVPINGQAELFILGLPSISAQKFYVVPYEEDGENTIKLRQSDGTEYLFVDWPIQFL